MRRIVGSGVIAAALTAAAVVAWVNVLAGPPAKGGTALVVVYAPPTIEIDDRVGLTHAEVAAEVGRLVNDQRGWRADMDLFTLRVVQPGVGGTTRMDSTGYIGMAHFNARIALVTVEAWTVLGSRFAAVGGTLEDQRTWIVLHELGHMLGHREHTDCPAPGQPAPVMRGTNWKLGGCAYNVWPNP
ncbi:DUF3152 domain-containing protein [Micromonospora sp. NPDC053740]|uniref:DUF3152 domain-containing protein n=1 Tax=Micromonospora sp. NPDC053740 TaxID=3155173 RepID=UPI003421292D